MIKAANLVALLTGTLFGAGLALSQMVNPYKVLAFLDLFGDWDPSLALVMGGALLLAAPAFHFILKRQKPVCEAEFDVPSKTRIDWRLLTGAMLFGSGWGIAGYCPGPAIATLTINWQEGVPFIAAMIVGGYLSDLIVKR